jgi:hypothetical protein
MAEDEVLHPWREMGRPTVWTLEGFQRRSKHRMFIGSKRVLKDA